MCIIESGGSRFRFCYAQAGQQAVAAGVAASAAEVSRLAAQADVLGNKMDKSLEIEVRCYKEAVKMFALR